jgi:WD40 repeat protein
MKRFFILVLCLYLVGIIYATAGDYPPITAENVMNLQEMEQFGQGNMSPSLAWSPDSSRLVVGGSGGLFLYESLDAEPEFIELGTGASAQLFAPDGNTVFAYFGGKLNAFDLATRTVRYQLDGVQALAMSANGQYLAYTAYRSVQVIEIANGELRYMLNYSDIWGPDFNNEDYYQYSRFVFAQFINDDAQLIVRWLTEDGDYYDGYRTVSRATDVWTLATNERQLLSEWDNSIQNNSDFAVVDTNGMLFSADVQSFPEVPHPSHQLTLNSNEQLVPDTDFQDYALVENYFAAPTGFWSESDFSSQQTMVWDINTGAMLASFPATGRLVLSPDGTKIAIGLTIYAIATGEQLRHLQTDLYRVLAGVHDRILLYGADDSLRLLDALTMEEIAVLPLLRSELADNALRSVDGTILLFKQDLRLAIRVSAITGQEIARYEADTALISPQYTADGAYLMVNNSATFALWDADSGDAVMFPADFQADALYFHSSHQVIGWHGANIALYDLKTGTYTYELPSNVPEISQGRAPSRIIQLSPDGQYIAVGYGEAGFVYRFLTGELITSYFGDAAFSPSSQLLAYGDSDGTVKVINLVNGSSLQEFQFDLGVPWVTSFYFSTDNLLAVSQSGVDGAYKAHTYSILTGQETRQYVFPQVPLQPFAEAHGLRYFAENGGIRIVWSESPISLNLCPDGFGSASLSSDGTLLYINYIDGRIGIWAVAD